MDSHGGEPGADGALPDLVPARMINEVLYCERLMYLEWVQGEFAHNQYTLEGKLGHRRVDAGGGGLGEPREASALPAEDRAPPEPGDGPRVARSVWLSSERLGITAKIDLVEEAPSGEVVPIEYKRGRRPAVEEGAYLPERAQLCAEVLLLRDSGYTCDRGTVYYVRDRQRVDIAIDEALVAATLGAVARAREVASAGRLPPPLDGSAKCVGCSLAPLCLPDEVTVLREAVADADATGSEGVSAARLRRLHPARDDRLPLYVIDHEARVGLKGECLEVRRPGEPNLEVRLQNTSHVAIVGNAQVTTQALRTLLSRGIPVAFFTGGGWLAGRAAGMDSNNVELRMAQHRAAADPRLSLAVARAIVASKIRNCRTMLRRNHADPPAEVLDRLREQVRRAEVAPSAQSLLGTEGVAARLYYSQLAGMLKADPGAWRHDFDGRNRRPPRDPVNALLSFAYSLLTKELVFALGVVGLDPLLGFYHRPRFGRPALALDLMEEFRPLVADSVVVSAINNGAVREGDFVISPVGVALKPAGRRKLISTFEHRMDQEVIHPVFGYRISYRRVLEVQARLLGRLLLGEIDAYPTFQTR